MAFDVVEVPIRTGTTTDWNAGPVLGVGEFGYNTTNFTFFVGDGTTAWASLKKVTFA